MKLVVENLPQDFPATEVHSAFACVGQCEILKTEAGVVWLQFAEEEKAREAIQKLHESDLGGNRIRVHQFLDTCHVTAEAERKRSRSRSRSPAKEAPPAEAAPVQTDASDQSHSPSKQETKPVPCESAPKDPAVEDPAVADPAPSAPVASEEAKAEPAVGEIVTEDDGSKFVVQSVNAKNDGLSTWKCQSCNRTLQKKSVKSHITTKTHKQRAAADS